MKIIMIDTDKGSNKELSYERKSAAINWMIKAEKKNSKYLTYTY